MSETRPLEGQAAVVTGASSGIGSASAKALAREGANVALAARREDRLDELASTIRDEHDIEALVVPTDVREESAVENMVEAAVERFDGIDVLVNNAGLALGSSVESMSTDEYRTMMETNADGMFFTTRAALPHLRESSGSLVFIGSFAGKFPRSFNPVYAATKWWTRGFAQSVSAQVGDDDVAITVVNPSETRTEIGSEMGQSFAETFEEGEVSEPEEIAEAVVFAASQDNSMVGELDIYRRDKFTQF